jgi:hypothetical protein
MAGAAVVRRVVLSALAGLAVLFGAAAQAAPAADPLDPGPFAVQVRDYNAGRLPIRFHSRLPGAKRAPPFEARLDARLYLPIGPAAGKVRRFPVALIIPARHFTCQLADRTEIIPTPGPKNPAGLCRDDPKAGTRRIHPERGYDYIGRALAGHGVAAVAVDVSDLTALDHASADTGDSTGRLKIAFAHLDWLRRHGTTVARRLDFNRVGFIGHSRGGAALGNITRDNAARRGFHYGVRAVLQIAAGGGLYATGPDGEPLPAADDNFMRVTGIPLAGISGDCDGDGSNAGFATFARSKYARADDEAPKFYWRIAGADHAFFNQVFTGDDADHSYGDPKSASFSVACNSASPGSLRLARPDQERIAQGYVVSFFRRYLLGETALDGFLAGEGPLPAELCPRAGGRPCGEIVNTSHIPPASHRRLILEPDDAAPLSVSPGGGGITHEGFDVFDWCEPFGRQPDGYAGPDHPKETREAARANIVLFARKNCRTAPPGFDPRPPTPAAENRYLQSIDRQLEIAWSRPAALTVSLGPGQRDVSRFAALRLRAFADYLDSRTPQPDRTNPIAAKAQKTDFDVVLTDEAGHTARVSAGAFSDSALTVPFRPIPTAKTSDNLIKLTLGGLRIPLAAFKGVDLARLATVRFDFGGPASPTGAIHLADVLFDAGTTP